MCTLFFYREQVTLDHLPLTLDRLIMVEITATYEGELHCSATHNPSSKTLETDAPVDNHGRGETFSPTDLVATALITCIATTMAIKAQAMEIELGKMRLRVEKHMSADSPRRIARLPVEICIPFQPDDRQRAILEKTAHACPVHNSLHADIDAPITIHWGNA